MSEITTVEINKSTAKILKILKMIEGERAGRNIIDKALRERAKKILGRNKFNELFTTI